MPSTACRRQRSGGHPLLLTELAATHDEALPAGLRAAFAAAADSAGRAGTTLRAASVVGPDLDLDVLAEVLRRPAVELLDDLEEGVRRRLLVERASGFAFRHSLVREALAADVGPTRRALLHRETARALHARGGADPLVLAHHARACLFSGTERFFRPGYAAHLVAEWLPALDGVVGKLAAGARVADVGCGHGASTILMAEAFPASTFTGFDYHAPSIEAARAATDVPNVTFEVAAAAETPGDGYDLVTTFDCLHDMGDPVGAARRIRQVVAADGTWLLVEPFAGDTLQDNLNPVGRLFYGVSTAVCTSHGVSQGDDDCLGAQAGLERLTKVAHDAGFTRVRLAAQTPFNLIIEVRP